MALEKFNNSNSMCWILAVFGLPNINFKLWNSTYHSQVYMGIWTTIWEGKTICDKITYGMNISDNVEMESYIQEQFSVTPNCLVTHLY
jgi:hypothetical protein